MGIERDEYSEYVQRELTLDDLSFFYQIVLFVGNNSLYLQSHPLTIHQLLISNY